MRLHPLLILATFIASFVQLHTADAQCECGYQDELGRIWQEALVLSSFANYTFNSTSDLRITENQLPNDSGINGVAAPYQIQNTKDNVMIQGRDLAIRVQSAVQKPYILGGEVTTMRNDILYGSFRSTLKTTSVLGTCAGFFHYGNRTNEVDIEILSVQAADRKVNFVQHEMILLPDNTPSPLSIQTPDVGVNPSADYNEYRFDWTPTSSDFFVNGNYILSLTANEPSKEGIVIWNHWSKGLQGWDQGPPLNDSYLLVRSFKLFFNTSDATGFNRRCNAARNSTNTTATARSVCSVAGITGDITSANSASGVENKKAQQNASDNSK
ncbi:glycoside hydrolase family 16 protein [Gonapodya prolifera JEL478]|uniref:Glycoside hydrolase family 16 protein n=1 Tax=Gonapodya prolifera (strain JEL478) TaxID=1344416 RepID=A0A139B0B2_GONPJ|nr:glycoside hydrolase family 16 protein [Gonapodya prolifera JEL478]|eukprot:KXS22431.1 glycoside hydrolase family 16 protein [Gonapodya prolifera JEL478]